MIKPRSSNALIRCSVVGVSACAVFVTGLAGVLVFLLVRVFCSMARSLSMTSPIPYNSQEPMNDIMGPINISKSPMRASVELPLQSINMPLIIELIEDTKQAKGGLYHASMLGVQMAKRVHELSGCKMFMNKLSIAFSL